MKNDAKGWQHCGTGTVQRVGAEPNGRSFVEIKHGKRKRRKDHKGAMGDFPMYDDRPDSRIALHADEVSRYKIGDKLDVATRPAKKQAPPVRGKKGPGKKRHAAKKAKRASRIASAMGY